MNKKGFTLVEIIVVLVILALLAAVALPSMLGFVNKTKKDSITSEARVAYTAAVSIASEMAGMAKEINEQTDNQIMMAIAGGDSEHGNIGNGGLKVTYNTDGSIASDTRTEKMKALLKQDAPGQVQVIVKDGKVKYFYYKREINGQVYDFVINISSGIAEYEITE